MLNEKALEAAKDAYRRAWTGEMSGGRGGDNSLGIAIAAYLSALLPEDAAGLVGRLLNIVRTDDDEAITAENYITIAEAASLIQSQAARIAYLESADAANVEYIEAMRGRIAELEATLAEALRLLGRYRTETPLGNQPHMIALEAETFAASARSLLTKDRQP